MIVASAFAVFILGMRHGADPDHLAAIDNLTRRAYARHPFWSRFVGALFAFGHTAMVVVLAALVGLLGTRLGRFGPTIELAGGWLSVIVLLTIAVLNLTQLRANGGTAFVGLRTKLFKKRFVGANGSLLAIPVGFLFGLGFETSSQIAVYGVALGVDAGPFGAAIVGATFCIGMIVTDTLDSLLVHRLISTRTSLSPTALRTWILAVTGVAVFVGCYEAAQLVGWKSSVPDLIVSAGLVTALVIAFAYVLFSEKAPLSEKRS